MKITNVEFIAKLPTKITKKRKWFLASCPILDVHSQGKTEKKARDNLRDALSLFFISCLERDTLDTVLKDCGFELLHTAVQIRKKPQPRTTTYINVPIPFLVRSTKQSECHV